MTSNVQASSVSTPGLMILVEIDRRQARAREDYFAVTVAVQRPGNTCNQQMNNGVLSRHGCCTLSCTALPTGTRTISIVSRSESSWTLCRWLISLVAICLPLGRFLVGCVPTTLCIWQSRCASAWMSWSLMTPNLQLPPTSRGSSPPNRVEHLRLPVLAVKIY